MTNAERSDAHRKTKRGVICKIYSAQISSSKKRGHIPPSYSRIELEDWMMSQSVFHELYNSWKNSSYEKVLKPSVDRTNSKLPYSFSNIQIMTWGENNEKGKAEKSTASKNRDSKKVIAKVSLNNGLVVDTFNKLSDAMDSIENGKNGISKVLNKRRAKAGGFFWEYQ